MNGGAKEAARGDDLIAGLEQAQADRKNGRHARGRGHAILGPFKGGQALFEHLHRGIGKPRVDRPLLLILEASRRLLRIVKNKTRSQEHGLGVLTKGGAMRAVSHGAGRKLLGGFLAHSCAFLSLTRPS